MRLRLFHFVMLLAFAAGGVASSDGQDPLGPRAKRARTLDDYTPRTLVEIAAASADAKKNRRQKKDAAVVISDILPSRVRVIYTGAARPLTREKKSVISRWAKLYAGSVEHYTVHYDTEMLFTVNGAQHWLVIRKSMLHELEEELKKGDAVDLYVIRFGALNVAGRWKPVLLVENFVKPE